jgi:hypothetical protein
LVEDLGSSNGTTIRRADGEEFRLEAGRKQILDEGDSAIVSKSLSVAPSGLRFPRGFYEAEQNLAEEPGVTRLVPPPNSTP